MIKTSGFILILICMVFGKVYAQDGIATGKLIDTETKLPVQNASIVAYDNKKIIYHTSSDSSGKFKIPKSFLTQTDYLKISSLSYDEIRIEIKHRNDGNSNDIDLGTFKLKAHTIELKEVTVNSKKRYRDTTKIDLSKQKFERSFMIDDLFSKKFGFTKDEKGKLYYKGKLINDIVVNGGTFFGKNNMDIYQLLPALSLDNIEITETNIDSITNITLPTPQLKINLSLKDKYKKGILGNLNLGAGTSGRYVANAGLYSYKNNEQVSLNLNSNNLNIGDNTIIQPKVDFSANGNNSILNTTRFTYRNVFANKIEVNFAIKGKSEDKKFTSESDRQEEDVNAFSKTFNTSDSRTFSIDEGNFNVLYKIDTLTTLNLTETFNHFHTRESDSLNYLIKLDSSTTSSILKKTTGTNNDLYTSEVNYQKRFSSKKGRLLTVVLKLNNRLLSVNEFDNVDNLSGSGTSKYYIDGHKRANDSKYSANVNYTEPISDSSFINIFAIYERDRLNYKPQIASDTTLSSSDIPSIITNDYLRPGIGYQKIFNKITLYAIIKGIIDIRNIQQTGFNNTVSFLNLDVDLKADYRINKKKSISLNYIAVTNYPGVEQLTSLNSTFDLISQNTGNILLRPEEKKSLKLDYSVRPTDSENIILSGQFDHYSSKFGYNISNDITSLQASKIDNIGNSNSAQVSFTLLKTISANKTFNYTNSIAYDESPSIISNKLSLNNGITINQSLSTSVFAIDSILTISPTLTSAYSKYFYQQHTVDLLTLTGYAKFAVQVKGYELNLYPLFNYNHSISNNHSLSANGEIRKSFFKNLGSVWLQAYDIFNSFKFYNNNVGASYYQSVKYSNVERYIILGLSFKFNNIK